MERDAVVIGVEGADAIVRLDRGGEGCGRCAEPGGCGGGSSVLGEMFGRRCSVFRIANAIEARPGQPVRLELDERELLKVALMAYLLPVALLVAGAFAATALGGGDAGALGGGAAGFGAGLMLLARFRRRRGRRAPRLVR